MIDCPAHQYHCGCDICRASKYYVPPRSTKALTVTWWVCMAVIIAAGIYGAETARERVNAAYQMEARV